LSIPPPTDRADGNPPSIQQQLHLVLVAHRAVFIMMRVLAGSFGIRQQAFAQACAAESIDLEALQKQLGCEP
jgi:hypothetical protein